MLEGDEVWCQIKKKKKKHTKWQIQQNIFFKKNLNIPTLPAGVRSLYFYDRI